MHYPTTRKTFFLFVILVLGAVLTWELYWRSEGYFPTIEDTPELWAANRAKVDQLGEKDVIIIGSSRALFDLQLNEWESVSGRRPLMLAIPGSTPTPVLQDLVENSDFAGTIVMGITPGLFFTPPNPEFGMWQRPSESVEQYHKGTYADKLNHLLSIPIQKAFAFLDKSDDDMSTNLDLATLINNLSEPVRVPTHPPFPQFAYCDLDRNTTMYEVVEQDTAYANMVKTVWAFYGSKSPPPDKLLEVVPVITDYVDRLVDEFESRGGKIIFARLPSSHRLREGERMALPRASFWEVLLEKTGVPGYHFEDYEELNKYECPESSHLSARDARTFTVDFAKILKKDGHL